MTIYAEVKLEQEQEKREALKEFLMVFYSEEYDSRSEIFYDVLHGNGNFAVSFVFDFTPPAKAISLLPDLGEIVCFRTVQEFDEDPYDYDAEDNAEVTDSDQADADAESDEKATDSEQTNAEPDEKAIDNEQADTKSDIDEIKAILDRSSSRSEFANEVAKWLGLSEKRQKAFVAFVELAQNMERVTWAKLEKEIVEKEIDFNSYDKQKVISAVRAKTGKLFPMFLKE